MKKWQLLDLIRRVHELTNLNEPVIVRSQSSFAITDQVPPIVARPVKSDFLIAQHGIEARDKVGDELGVTSGSYEVQGYYADPLGLATVVLVPGWEARLQPLTDESGTAIARCLELHDVAISKLMAGRNKDFVTARL